MITFRAEDHTYWDGDIRIPGVSEILQAGGDMYFPKGGDTTARDRGTAVHKAVETWDRLGVDDVSDEINGYLDGWKWFLKTNRYNVVHSEMVVGFHNPKGYVYGGTLDLIVIDHKGKRGLIDIKSGSRAKWHVYQLAAYKMAAEQQECLRIDFVMDVYLKPKAAFPSTDSWDTDDAEYIQAAKYFGKLADRFERPEGYGRAG